MQNSLDFMKHYVFSNMLKEKNFDHNPHPPNCDYQSWHRNFE